MKVLLIDAFDSFVYTIEQYYKDIGCHTKVVRVSDNPIEQSNNWKPDLLVLGPGPGSPSEHGYNEIIDNISNEQAIFGVCLGLQAIGEYFNFKLKVAPSIEHGKYSEILHDKKGVFLGIDTPIKVVRYHSLTIKKDESSNDIIITAYEKSNHLIMGLRHKSRPIEAVQFHPESIGTKSGYKMIENSLNLAKNKEGKNGKFN